MNPFCLGEQWEGSEKVADNDQFYTWQAEGGLYLTGMIHASDSYLLVLGP